MIALFLSKQLVDLFTGVARSKVYYHAITLTNEENVMEIMLVVTLGLIGLVAYIEASNS